MDDVVKVLIIEDNPGDVLLVSTMLNQRDYASRFERRTARTIAEGQAALRAHDVDVVLLDLNLPDSDNLSTFTTLYNEFPHLPFVILTVVSLDEVALNAVKLGAQDYLVKGDFDAKLLTRVIKYAISRKRKEDEFYESESRNKAILDNSMDSITMLDENGRIIYANQKMIEMFKMKSEEISGLLFAHLLDPSSRREFAEKTANLKRKDQHFETSDVKGLKVDGSRLDLDIRGTKVKFDGAPVHLIFIRDITEKKRIDDALNNAAEELERKEKHRTMGLQKLNRELRTEIEAKEKAKIELNNEKERLAVTMHSMGDAIITTDASGKIVMMNRIAEEITGQKFETAKGRDLRHIFRPLHEDGEGDLIETLQRNRGTVNMINGAQLIPLNGTKLTIEYNGASITNSQGEMIGTVIVFRDVTNERMKEKDIARNDRLESVGQLAGGIAHDFNNILTAVQGNADIVLHNDLSKEIIDEKMRIIEREVIRAKALTQELIIFSQGGAPVKTIVDLRQLIKEVSDFVLSGSTIAIELKVDPDLWNVQADEGQLGNAIMNILLNSKESMLEGGWISVNCRNGIVKSNDIDHCETHEVVQIDIIDRGCGIPKDVIDKVFEPFFSTKDVGRGLGLTIARSIVKSHNGNIAISSEEGKGTTVSICLRPHHGSTGPRSSVEKGAMGQDEGLTGRVLIMDDEEAILDVIGEALKMIGFDVVSTTKGEDAISQYSIAMEERTPFDLVILDLTVPGGMGGRDTMKKLLEIDKNVNAIVSSGYSTDPVMANYKDYGFIGVMPKPYTFIELKNILSSVLSQRSICNM